MAVSKCKGTLLKVDLASVLTTVAQLVTLKPPKIKSEDFENVTLDQAGVFKGRELTGYAEADDFDAELFWDPQLSNHAKFYDNIATPAKTILQITFVNAGASAIDFTVAGMEFGAEIKMNDGLKTKIKGNVDGAAVLTV